MAATVAALEDEFAFQRLVAVLAVLRDKDARTMLEQLDSIVDSIVVTRNSSPRSLSAADLAVIATDVLGEDRVRVEPSLPDAIQAAVDLVETDVEGELSGVGVIITGSVITVADARGLLRR